LDLIINKFFNKRELFIVSVGSGIIFSIKCLLVIFNHNFNILPLELFYLLTHIFIFFLSWVFHSKISFKSQKDKNNFNRFLGYKVFSIPADYLLVILMASISGVNPVIFLAISSIIIFVIRYIVFRTLVFK
jgi:hypothetical protein